MSYKHYKILHRRRRVLTAGVALARCLPLPPASIHFAAVAVISTMQCIRHAAAAAPLCGFCEKSGNDGALCDSHMEWAAE